MTEDKSKLGGILRYRFIAMGASGLLIVVGIILFFVLGFNTGIDFGSGYSERIQIAPVGFTVSYSGTDNAVLSVNNRTLELTIRSSDGVAVTSFTEDVFTIIYLTLRKSKMY